MKCPVCNTDLHPEQAGDMEVDVCPKCSGVWFNPGELGRVAAMLSQDAGTQALSVADVFGKGGRQISPAGEPDKICPECGLSTNLFQYAYDSGVFLNRCPVCGGIWADTGEVLGIARYLKGNPLADRLGDSLLNHMKKNREESCLYSKAVSGAVMLVYLALGICMHNVRVFLYLVLYLILPLACIWFAREMAAYTGLTGLARPAITRISHPRIVALCGWILLLIPLAGLLISLIQSLLPG